MRIRKGKSIRNCIMALLYCLALLIGIFAEATSVYAVSEARSSGRGITEHIIQAGDTTSSPASIERLDRTDNPIVGAGALTAGQGSTYFYRLKLGDGRNYADAYCGNYGLHARGNTTYTCIRIDPEFRSPYTYKLIQAVVSMNAYYAIASSGSEHVADASYKAGQIAIWRILYLDSLGKVDSTYSNFYTYNAPQYTAMLQSMCRTFYGTVTDDYMTTLNNLMGNYINAAHRGTYADHHVYCWSSGDSQDQLLYTGENVPPYEKYGKIDLVKSSSVDASVKVSGCVYGIYRDRACTDRAAKMTATDNEGYAISGWLPVYEADHVTKIPYWVKEISSNGKYEVNTKVYGGSNGIKLTADATFHLSDSYTIEDKPYHFDIQIIKKGYEKNGNISGAVFELQEWNGSKYVRKKNLSYNSTTKKYESGTLYYTSVNQGKFKVVETACPPGYVLENTDGIAGHWYQEFVITSGNNGKIVTATCTNYPKSGSASVIKKDAGTGTVLSGAVFALHEWNGSAYVYRKNLTYNSVTKKYETGMLSWTDANQGKYKITEANPPYKYYLGNYSQTFVIEKYHQEFSFSAGNAPVRVNLSVQKADAEKKTFTSQGNADMKKTMIALYAAEDIYSADGKSLAYHKDELIDTKYVDSSGKAEWKNFPLGNYYAKEAQAGPGYLGDYNTKYPLNAENQYKAEYTPTTQYINTSVTIYNPVMKQPFAIHKFKDYGEEFQEPLQGAGFCAYLKSSLTRMEDGNYDFAHGQPIVIGAGGETELFTDENGFLQSIPLPYGTYVIVESTVPHNYQSCEPIEIVLDENSNEPEQVTVGDKEFRVFLKVIKKDSESKHSILQTNTEFRIQNLDTQTYVEQNGTTYFHTDASGVLELSEPLRPGRYLLEEYTAPYGYLRSGEAVEIVVDIDCFLWYDQQNMEAELTVEYTNQNVRGKLLVQKTGEALIGFENGKFCYRDIDLEGAEYDLCAAETIYTMDGQEDETGQRTKYYEKDQLVAHLVTDENGQAETPLIPLGNYYLQETKAPIGYVRSTDIIPISFTYTDQTIEIVEQSVRLSNERQGAKIILIKRDSLSGDRVAGALYGIYAAQDIVNFNAETIVEKDTLLQQVKTTENGEAVFGPELPLGRYYIKEIEAPAGWILSQEVIEVDVPYREEENSQVSVEVEAEEYPTITEICKTDITGEQEVEGALLELYASDGKLVESWVSGKEAHKIYGLPQGEYRLHEERAPEGYMVAEDITFFVTYDTDAQGKPIVTTVTMRDEENPQMLLGYLEKNIAEDAPWDMEKVKENMGNRYTRPPHTGEEEPFWRYFSLCFVLFVTLMCCTKKSRKNH